MRISVFPTGGFFILFYIFFFVPRERELAPCELQLTYGGQLFLTLAPSRDSIVFRANVKMSSIGTDLEDLYVFLNNIRCVRVKWKRH